MYVIMRNYSHIEHLLCMNVHIPEYFFMIEYCEWNYWSRNTNTSKAFIMTAVLCSESVVG